MSTGWQGYARLDAHTLSGCEQLAVAADALVDGIHFPAGTSPAAIAYKSLAVNLSDMAAMAARPLSAIYTLGVDRHDAQWIETFETALHTASQEAGIDVAGTVSHIGMLMVSLQITGSVQVGRELTRAGARPGDAIMVTGTLGDAGGGLAIAKQQLELPPADRDYLLRRLEYPTPRVTAGIALADLASAAIDLSDGLISDLGHIVAKSRCGAAIETDKLPLSAQLLRGVGRARATDLALSAGDDYELCFSCPPENVAEAGEVLREVGVRATRIGRADSIPGIRCLAMDGEAYPFEHSGYEHFR